MKELLNFLQPYDILTNLLPGMILLGTCEWADINMGANIDISNPLFFLISYIIGLLASRIGSLIVEPIYKKFSRRKLAPYTDYIAAEKVDGKISTLMTTANFYRTMLVISAMLFVEFACHFLPSSEDPQKMNWNFLLLSVAMMAVFACSYAKQLQYVKKRVNQVKGECQCKTKR